MILYEEVRLHRKKTVSSGIKGIRNKDMCSQTQQPEEILKT